MRQLRRLRLLPRSDGGRVATTTTGASGKDSVLALWDAAFRYPSAAPRPPLLPGTNVALGAGDQLLVVGHNGAGKSALLQTLCGIVGGGGAELAAGVRSAHPRVRCAEVSTVEFIALCRAFLSLRRASDAPMPER